MTVLILVLAVVAVQNLNCLGMSRTPVVVFDLKKHPSLEYDLKILNSMIRALVEGALDGPQYR